MNNAAFSTHAKLAVYAKLLMAAQKNLLLVGAPGVGKTRLARIAAHLSTRDYAEPIVVVGRDGLTYDKLVAYYTAEEDRLQLRLGDLSKAVLSSWARIALGLGPRYFVIDEINRSNVDVLLGEVFTAMDIEHRMSTPVIRGGAYAHVERLADSGALEELGLEGQEELEALRNVLKVAKVRRLGGIPMPYAFRMIATMNLYDRAQLYKLGHALQRRFAYLYVPPPFEELNPKLDVNDDKMLSKGARKIYDQLKSPNSPVVETALREMSGEPTPSLVAKDYPTAPFAVRREELSEAFQAAVHAYDDTLKLAAYVYVTALRGLGVELGVSTLVDLVKFLTAAVVVSAPGKPLLTREEAADLALSALVLPHLSAAVPKARGELLLRPEGGLTYKALKDLVKDIVEALGEGTLSARVMASYDIPRLPA